MYASRGEKHNSNRICMQEIRIVPIISLVSISFLIITR